MDDSNHDLGTPLTLTACHECDLLQTEPAIGAREELRCPRCLVLLDRAAVASPMRAAALAITAAQLFLIANICPLVSMELNGDKRTTTLLGAVIDLYQDGRWQIALLVLTTTILMPMLQIGLMLYLLLPLSYGRAPRAFAGAFRTLVKIKPWAMTEVFMLGILVALVKLAVIAKVEVGIAMWAFAALIVCLAALSGASRVRDLWRWRERLA